MSISQPSSNSTRTLTMAALLTLGVIVPNRTTASGNPTGTLSDPIVDSRMTREEALRGVRCNPPKEILDRQSLVNVQYWGMSKSSQPDDKIHHGQLVIDQSLVSDVEEIFEIALGTRFAIHSVEPVAAYDWSDAASMNDNNTSAWNYRGVGSGRSCPDPATSRGSKHANMKSGSAALDINPKLNPYCHSGICEPEGSSYNPSAPGTLTRNHPIVKVATATRGSQVIVEICEVEDPKDCSMKTFKGLGWSWGGDWNSPDYQHLQK